MTSLVVPGQEPRPRRETLYGPDGAPLWECRRLAASRVFLARLDEDGNVDPAAERIEMPVTGDVTIVSTPDPIPCVLAEDLPEPYEVELELTLCSPERWLLEP